MISNNFYKMQSNRKNGLDTLRSAAIILVFLFHCPSFSNESILGSICRSGWVGVDLFFVLSGYLIGNKILSGLIKKEKGLLKTFYLRRLLRILPSYLFVLVIYFAIPFFREQPLITPLWKFLTFSQNFGLSFSAFSHAWSLCLEQQFYFALPIITIIMAYKGNMRNAWLTVGIILLAGIILRGYLWLTYIQYAEESKFKIYMANIYYPTFSRLDGLVLGVSIAMLKNFHENKWIYIASKGNWFLSLGVISCYLTFHPLSNLFGFYQTVFGYFFRSTGFAALTVAALSYNTLLHRIKIPGAETLAAWSYAIYLTHKQLIHMTHEIFFYSHINSSTLEISTEILISLAGGWLLYTCIETPFLKLSFRKP